MKKKGIKVKWKEEYESKTEKKSMEAKWKRKVQKINWEKRVQNKIESGHKEWKENGRYKRKKRIKGKKKVTKRKGWAQKEKEKFIDRCLLI